MRARGGVRFVLVVLAVGAGAACGARAGEPVGPGDAGQEEGDAGAAASSHLPGLDGCAQAPGPVSSVRDVVALLNRLPRPVSPACFLAALERPLAVVATFSKESAQPAASRQSPRLFILTPGAALSLVPEGPGGLLLEVGQWVSGTRTLKAELEFPVDGLLDEGAPFRRVETNGSATTCGVCHRQEARSSEVDGGYVSMAFQPNPGNLVPLAELVASHETCAASQEQSQRCEMFHALFDFGVVTAGAFAPGVPLFVQ